MNLSTNSHNQPLMEKQNTEPFNPRNLRRGLINRLPEAIGLAEQFLEDWSEMRMEWFGFNDPLEIKPVFNIAIEDCISLLQEESVKAKSSAPKKHLGRFFDLALQQLATEKYHPCMIDRLSDAYHNDPQRVDELIFHALKTVIRARRSELKFLKKNGQEVKCAKRFKNELFLSCNDNLPFLNHPEQELLDKLLVVGENISKYKDVISSFYPIVKCKDLVFPLGDPPVEVNFEPIKTVYLKLTKVTDPKRVRSGLETFLLNIGVSKDQVQEIILNSIFILSLKLAKQPKKPLFSVIHTFVWSTAKNIAYNILKKGKEINTKVELDTIPDRSNQNDIEKEDTKEIQYNLLANAILELTAEQQQLFDFVYRQKKTAKEIAREMKIKDGALRGRLFRMRERIKKLIYNNSDFKKLKI